MPKRYLFFISLSYSYSILRPLQKAIRKRGDEVVWFLTKGCPNWLMDDEILLETIAEAQSYNPTAVFAPGNYIYDFIPGVKVAVFHGYPVGKRGEKQAEKLDDHFTIREWFDIYCTQGESSTSVFQNIAKNLAFFKTYETGWCKVDPFFTPLEKEFDTSSTAKTILYSPTFSKGISSVETLFDTIKILSKKREWNWIITFHPKITDPKVIANYQTLAQECNNVSFEANKGLTTFQRADIMLCDSSSIIMEFMLLNKPVVTFRNTNPGPHLLDVQNEEEIEGALNLALMNPPELIKNITEYTHFHESHRDGCNSKRVLEAVDHYTENYQGKIKRKPLNLIRKIKQRFNAGYYHW
ncbi:MAG: CDP-glycerol glycerophosphotransferase family protein [Paraglaciecola sp.]|nr:CDP-glycerol glycerophosphotransferase family protein [Paraglaciecola sp.]